MVLPLYVLAGVMVAGGLLAMYSGSDIIVMERGWTMVISGSVMAASGTLLAGIATAVSRLEALRGEFERFSDRLARSEAPSFSLPPEAAAETVPPLDRRSAPPLTVAPGMTEHRDLDIAPEPILAPLASAETQPERGADAASEPIEALLQADARISESEAPPEPTPEDEAEEPPPPTVVGTYNSGGNFYIMYSDGSIEAETPAGKFSFDSLEELKDFIAAGGDRPKAAAPV